MNTLGTRLRTTLFGESHGPGVGAVLDGMPAGLPIDTSLLAADMALRRPGGELASARGEPDTVTFLSGVHQGAATGTPLCLWIPNTDARPQDYEALQGPRPGHADWTQHLASGGHADLRGGGFHSGRITAPMVAAGSLARGILAPRGIEVGACLVQAGLATAPQPTTGAADVARAAADSPLRVVDTAAEARLRQTIDAARRAKDSLGGIVAFVADGVPPGWGNPHVAGLEGLLAQAFFAIPGVKAVEFGHGIVASAMQGSAHNDPFQGATKATGGLAPASNHAGGILGGRSTGAPLWGRVAFKPAASIAQTQQTAAWEGGTVAMSVQGRHDPCIAVRGVAVVAACARLVLADLALSQGTGSN